MTEQKDLPEDLPYALVEIVSPDNRYDELMTELRDYDNAGIEFIFVADPPLRQISRYLHGDLLVLKSLDLPAYEVAIPAEKIFR